MIPEHGFMDVLIKAVKQVRRGNNGNNVVNLDTAQTMEFFACRKEWGDLIEFTCRPGEVKDTGLPPFSREVSETVEKYTMAGVEIVPKFAYHGIVYFFLSRAGRNIFA